ncbi:MAG: hypothetical protein ACRDUV_18440 [Pseudonocardiaceae bacterium]
MRVRRRCRPELVLPERGLVVPLLAATGGTGRSTVCHLLAARFAAHARTCVLDTAPWLASPWPGWLTRPGTAALAAGVFPTAQQVFAAAGTVNTATGTEFTVLPAQQERIGDHCGWHQVDQMRLLRTVSARASLVDTTAPLLLALAADDVSSTARPRHMDVLDWLTAPGAIPVLCIPASAKGVADALTAVTALEQRGIASHLHVAVAGIAASDLPRRVLAGLTLLEPRVAAVVRLPHDPWLRASSRPRPTRASSRLQEAIDGLANLLGASGARPEVPAPADTTDATV